MAASGKIMGIVAGLLVVVLLAACGGLFFLNKQQAGRAAVLEEAVLKISTAAGLTDITPEALQVASNLPGAFQRIQDSLAAQQQELQTTKEALTTAGTEAANAKAEADAQIKRAQEQADKVTSLTKDLEGKDASIDSAKEAAAAAEKEKQALSAEVAKMKTDLEAAQQKVQALETAATAAAPETAEGTAQPGSTEGAEVAAEVPATGEAASPAEAEEPAGKVVGKSEMFRSIKYTADKQELVLRLADGQTLTYKDVPDTTFGGLIVSVDIDKYFRFKIQGVFTSTPVDKQAIQDFWRHIRNRPTLADVKLIE